MRFIKSLGFGVFGTGCGVKGFRVKGLGFGFRGFGLRV